MKTNADTIRPLCIRLATIPTLSIYTSFVPHASLVAEAPHEVQHSAGLLSGGRPSVCERRAVSTPGALNTMAEASATRVFLKICSSRCSIPSKRKHTNEIPFGYFYPASYNPRSLHRHKLRAQHETRSKHSHGVQHMAEFCRATCYLAAGCSWYIDSNKHNASVFD